MSPDVGDLAFDRAGGGGERAGEERPAALPLAALEVSVRGGDAVLAFFQLVAVHRDAHGAARLAPLAARLAEDLVEPLGLGLLLDRHAAGDDHDPRRLDLLS